MAKFALRDQNAKRLDHWDGYLGWLQSRGTPFPLLPLQTLLDTTEEERRKYDEARLAFISDEMIVGNETVNCLADTLSTVMTVNLGRKRGGLGVFLSAPSGLGKTTAVHSVLCEVLKDVLDADPTCIEEDRSIPVGYICIPDSGTPKSIYMEIADYLGIEYMSRDNDPQMRKMVLTGIAHAGIQVFAIDEAHNLDNGGSYMKRAVDSVRRLGDDTRTTFILAGINLEQSSLMRGERGRQIAGRYIKAGVAQYDRGIPGWQGRWKGLVGAMASAMPLYATRSEDLMKLAAPLHKQANGSVQQLNSILTQTASKLIRQQDPARESITEGLLSEARLNLSTELHARAECETRTVSGKRARPRSR